MNPQWLILILLAAGTAAWLAGRWGSRWPRWISLVGLGVYLVWALSLWAQAPAPGAGADVWLAEQDLDWIPQFGIRFHLAVDGLSLLMVLLTGFSGLTAVICSWTEIQERVGFFHFTLMWTLSGIVGVFLALDLFLFYFFWEMMLVPMYLLIAIWGHENRVYAAVKFFIYTQASGLLMLLAILGLYYAHAQTTGNYTFDYTELLGTSLEESTARWLMLGFFIAFAVKLPAVPVHNWLPDAHTEAPTAGSVILAGVLLKTGAYGLLRFAVPLFPQAALELAPIAMVLGVIGILYGAKLTFAQTDLKRLVAYSSISHMGFVLLGVFAWNDLALQGAVMQMICHGLSTGALFILVGALQEQTGTRQLDRLGGLWATAPRMAGVGLFLALASLGLPGLGNFVGEFLVLMGAYRVSVPMTVLAALGLVAAPVYALWMVQRTFHGPNPGQWRLADLAPRHMGIMAATIVCLVWLGLGPQPVMEIAKPALHTLRGHAAEARAAVRASEAPLTWQSSLPADAAR